MRNYAQNPRVRYIPVPARFGSPSKTRNFGIAQTHGEFVAFLDADDVWLPTKLERQMRLFQQDPKVGLVYCGRECVTSSGQRLLRPAPRASQSELLKLLLLSTPFCPSSVVVRKSCLTAVGGFDEALEKVEDRDLWLRLCAQHKFDGVEECLVEYLVHDEAWSTKPGSMELAYRKVLAKAFAAPPLRGRLLLWCRARAFMHYDFSWVYHVRRQHGKAARHAALSVIYYPIADPSGRLFGQPFARYRRLLRYLLMPNADLDRKE
jgi:glycosyltransferase involved in cell wall biosynthesis